MEPPPSYATPAGEGGSRSACVRPAWDTVGSRGDGGGGWELTPGWGRHGAGQVSCDAFNFSGHGEEEAGPPAETPRSGMQCCRREDWREVAGEESEPAGRGSGAGSPGRPKFTITTVT